MTHLPLRWLAAAALRLLTGVAPVLLTGATVARAAEEPNYDPTAAFAEVDVNRDGYVDREEFHRRQVDVFFHGDTDKDGYMSMDEVRAAVVFPEDFENADKNDDDRIALYEFIAVRFYQFDDVDTDKDGRLSLEEVEVEFARPRK